MKLPKVLIIDDERYWDLKRRQRLCKSMLLRDITCGANAVPDDNGNYLADATFARAQVLHGKDLRNDPQPAIEAIRERWSDDRSERWALIMLDLRFYCGHVTWPISEPHENAKLPVTPGDSFGLEILKAMAREWHKEGVQSCELPVVALSNRPRGELEKQLGEYGNLGYIERDEKSDLAASLLRHLLDCGLIEDIGIPSINNQGKVSWKPRSDTIVGNSLPLLRALRDARTIARSDAPSLIMGPQGVRKGQFAKYIHDHSVPHAKSSFVSVDCARSDAEEKLFGKRSGLLCKVYDGTLHLENIGALSLKFQSQLYSHLTKARQPTSRSSRVRREGRIVASLWRDSDMGDATRFSPNLHAALSRRMLVPSLEERIGDISGLFVHYLESAPYRFGFKNQTTELKEIADETLKILEKRKWMSNEKGLEVAAHVAATKSGLSHVICPVHLPSEGEIDEHVLPSGEEAAPSAAELKSASKEIEELKRVLQDRDKELEQIKMLRNLPSLLKEMQIPEDNAGLTGIIERLLSSFEDLVGRTIGTAFVVRSGGVTAITKAQDKTQDGQAVDIYQAACSLPDVIMLVSPSWCKDHMHATARGDYFDRLDRLVATLQGDTMSRKGSSNRSRPKQVIHNFLVRVMEPKNGQRVELAPTEKRQKKQGGPKTSRKKDLR